ncbi:MAG: hypothetical protein GQ578_00565, partial [Desulfuromonadaceae bacterium]|nr:hypothetical protein [Desulfuromonadaceae bacterium]
PVSRVNYEFVFCWLQSQKIMDLIWLDAVQSAQPNLSMENLGNFYIPCPIIDEQSRIVGFIKEQDERISAAITLNANQIQLLQEYRTTLISDAVTGKIDIREEAA